MTETRKPRSRPVAPQEAVEGEVVTPRNKLEERRAKNADKGLAPRRPEDFRRKKELKAAPDEVEVEFDGFLYVVDPTILDDWELMERIESGEQEEQELPAQYLAMLGPDGYEELKENVREKHGRVSLVVMSGFMEAVMKEAFRGN